MYCPSVSPFRKESTFPEVKYSIDKIGLEEEVSSYFQRHQDALSQLTYFPETSKLGGLIYLTTFKKNEKNNRSIFTQKQERIFKESIKADMTTKRALLIGIVVATVFTVLGALFNYFTTLVGLNDEDDGLTSALLTGIVTGFAAFLSFYATGHLPDQSSIKANTSQNTLSHEVLPKFEHLATKLITLYDKKNKNLALIIANNIKIDTLKKLALKFDKKEDNLMVTGLLNDLNHVVKYLLNKEKTKTKISSSLYTLMKMRKYYPLSERDEEL